MRHYFIVFVIVLSVQLSEKGFLAKADDYLDDEEEGLGDYDNLDEEEEKEVK